MSKPGQGGGQLYKNLPFFYSQVIATDQNAAPPSRLLARHSGAGRAGSERHRRAVVGQSERLGLRSAIDARHAVEHRHPARDPAADLLVDVSYVGTRTVGLHRELQHQPVSSRPRRAASAPSVLRHQSGPRRTSPTARTMRAPSIIRCSTRWRSGTATGFTAVARLHVLEVHGQRHEHQRRRQRPAAGRPLHRCEWGSMPEDRNHIVVLNHNWELPFGKGRRYRHQRAAAATSSATGTSPASGSHVHRREVHRRPPPQPSRTPPVAAATVPIASPTATCPPTSAPSTAGSTSPPSSRPPQFTFGNAGRGILVGPGNFNVDCRHPSRIPLRRNAPRPVPLGDVQCLQPREFLRAQCRHRQSTCRTDLERPVPHASCS